MIKIRAAVILEKNGKILLARHKKKNDEYWVIPGGTVEKNETLKEAAIREIREETGLAVKIRKLVFVSEVIQSGENKHIVDFFFKGSIISGSLEKGVDRCLAEIKFVPINEIDSLEFRPDIKKELKAGFNANFKDSGKYLGNRSRIN